MSLVFRFPTKLALALLCLLLFVYPLIVHADVVTQGSFNLDFSVGESFTYEDDAHNADITFTISSGSLTGIGVLNINVYGGSLTVTPSSVGVLTVSSSNPSVTRILINFAEASSISFTSGTQFQVTWTYNYTYVPPIIMSDANGTLYFRSDTFYANNVTGYGLHTENTATYATVNDSSAGDVNASFGFRVWHVNSRGNLTELTDGEPAAVVTRTEDGVGFQSGSWSVSYTTLTTGQDVLKVIAYVRFAGGEWEAVATFISQPLMEKAIRGSTWNFTVYTTRNYTSSTSATFCFGSLDRASCICGVDFWHPVPQEVALAMGLGGDFISMFIYPFMYLIADLFYGCGLLFLSVLYYLRYKRWEPVLIMVLLFGGGGLFGYLIPNIAYRLLYVVVLFVIATQLYRVFN